MKDRECPTCPPYVVRCAHWEGQTLVLTEFRGITVHREPCSIVVETCPIPFHVHHVGRYAPCDTCGAPDVMHGIEIESFTHHYDLPAATDEFLRREAALLGREVVA